MNITNQKLAQKLKSVLVSRNFNNNFTDDYLEYEVELAIGVINSCRRFTPTSNKPYDTKYEYLIIPMCVAAIAKMGAEGQTAHSENGISRTYGSADDYPKELVQKIVPLIK